MALCYDFDIFSVIPKEIHGDPKIGGMLDELGFDFDAAGNKVALFRDPRTAEALGQAPDAIRNLLLDSGFGLNTFSSGAPEGRYPATDEAARLHVMDRLTQNLRTGGPFPPTSADPSAFSLADFNMALIEAEPIDMKAAAPLAHAEPGPHAHPDPAAVSEDADDMIASVVADQETDEALDDMPPPAAREKGQGLRPALALVVLAALGFIAGGMVPI